MIFKSFTGDFIKKNSLVVSMISLVVFMTWISGCGFPNRVQDTEVSASPVVEKRFKLTFKPDRNNKYFTDREISEFLDKSKDTGKVLNYEITSQDKASGKVSFVKNYGESNGSVIAEVLIDIMKNRMLAYIYITIRADSESVADAAMSEFKKQYTSKFR